MNGGGDRVPIPAGVRKIIRNIKEVTANHSDEEIYAMLRECAMDPDDTTQKLLLQDTFHEVKRKRDKRKESVREPIAPRWRSGSQGRGGRGSRGSSRYVAYDAGSRNTTSAKKNSMNQGPDKGNVSSPSITLETDNKSTSPTTSSDMANGPSNMGNRTAQVSGNEFSSKKEISNVEVSKQGDIKSTESGPKDVSSSTVPGSAVFVPAKLSSASGVCASASDRILVPSLDAHNSTEAGTIKRAIGSHRTSVLQHKEWKPKLTRANPGQASGIMDSSDARTTMEAIGQSLTVSHSSTPKETITKLEKRMDGLDLDRHVIIPNHLQVPESERHGLSFGSFDAEFKLNFNVVDGLVIDKIDASQSYLSKDIEENADKSSLSKNITLPAVQNADYTNHPLSPIQIEESYSSRETAMPSISTLQGYDAAKPEPVVAPVGLQYSVVHTVPYSASGVIPQVLGTQFTSYESSDPQACDNTPVPGLMVPQPFDPSTSYYTQLYQPTADADGRYPPFLAPGGGSSRYNGSITMLPPQTGHASQESGNSVVLSVTGPTLTTQTVGVMQSSIAVPQQPIPVFRQAAGAHVSTYPSNYIPYSQYYAPFYMPPPALHFLSTAAFPQQPPSGSVYVPPAATAGSTPAKYPVSQYKIGTNAGNSTHAGMPTDYGTYNPNQTGYSLSPTVSTSNSNGSDEINSSQFKENNVYISGQQNEGSAVWIPVTGRDVSSLPPSSYYNIQPQGQHMTFAPTQSGHGAFSGVYHPTQSVPPAAVHPLLQQSQTVPGAFEMLAPPAGAYQQSQCAQMNWPSNY